MKKADIGLIGLAVMGENLVMNMESKGFTVAVYNRTTSKVDAFVNGRAAVVAQDAVSDCAADGFFFLVRGHEGVCLLHDLSLHIIDALSDEFYHTDCLR